MVGNPENDYSIDSKILNEDGDICNPIKHENDIYIITGCSFPKNQKVEPYLIVYFGTAPHYHDSPDTIICRISMLEPKYLGYEYESIMNKHQKERFIEVITKYWNKAIKQTNNIFANDESGLMKYFGCTFDKLQNDFPIPDYSKLQTID